MPTVKTIQFPNTPGGQNQKNEMLSQALGSGWKVISETITPGRYKTENACCMFILCGPCGGFMGGHTDGTINVTLQHDGNPNLETPFNEMSRDQIMGKIGASSDSDDSSESATTSSAKVFLLLVAFCLLLVLFIISKWH